MKFVLLFSLGIVTQLSCQVFGEFATGNYQFTADVYKELMKTHPGNFLVCPLSAEIILGLVHAGAGGETAKQLSAGLHLPKSKQEIERSFRDIIPRLREEGQYTLSSANKIYVKDGYEIKKEFKSKATDVFDSEIENIDFEKNEEAASEINRWVEEQTDSKIKNLIEKDKLNSDTRAVLINAMYFLGKWKWAFKESDTSKRRFYLDNQGHVEVDMMHQEHHFNYYANDELQARFLEMPYQSSDITMTFVLPFSYKGLPALEARINEVFVAPKYKSQEEVLVQIPKFKIESKIDFNEILKSLGIEDVFEDNADLSGILVNQPLKISDVIQKTYIEVEEKGTRAAVATEVVGIQAAKGPPRFIADHPFIFYIKIRDVVFFVGRYTSPSN